MFVFIAVQPKHGATEEYDMIALKAGLHKIRVEYYEQGGGSTLEVYYQRPGIEKQQIPSDILFYPKE